jgi:GGDEF domain-containing protein
MGIWSRESSGKQRGAAENATAVVIALVEAIRDSAALGPAEERNRYKDNLTKLSRSVRADMTPDSWRRLQRDLGREISSFAKVASAHARRYEARMRESLAALALLAEVIAPTEQHHSVRFRGLAKKLRRLASSRSFETIDQKLGHEIRTLERYAQDQEIPQTKSVERLARAVSRHAAWTEAVDPLTGLPDSLEARAAFERRIRAACEFIVVHLRIDRLGGFAERHGADAVSTLVRQFSRRLQHQLDDTTPVYRWVGGEFLVFVEGKAVSQMERWAKVQSDLSGVYRLRVGAGHVQYSVHCVASVIEYSRGESLEDCLSRGLQSRLQRVHPVMAAVEGED